MAPLVPKDAPVERLDFGMGPVICHAWSPDRSQVACSFGSEIVYIFRKRAPATCWEKVHELCQHNMRVTSVDWAPKCNRIVTCAQDKNSFVWTYEGDAWKPMLVVARLSFAATCVKWSPLENKIAIGGAKCVSVGFYEAGNNWWVFKHIKKPIRSTVSSIDWHPNNVLLAVGSYDYRARVFSAYIKETDGNKQCSCTWASKLNPLGTLLADFAAHCGWVRSIQFSPSGNRLCWAGQDSTLRLVDSITDIARIVTLKLDNLPQLTVLWISESVIVAGGFDYCPVVCRYEAPDNFKVLCKLDVPSAMSNGNHTAMNMFRSLDSYATAELNVQLKTLHQNTISQIVEYSRKNKEVSVFSTASMDGTVMLWPLEDTVIYCQKLKNCQQAMASA